MWNEAVASAERSPVPPVGASDKCALCAQDAEFVETRRPRPDCASRQQPPWMNNRQRRNGDVGSHHDEDSQQRQEHRKTRHHHTDWRLRKPFVHRIFRLNGLADTAQQQRGG